LNNRTATGRSQRRLSLTLASGRHWLGVAALVPGRNLARTPMGYSIAYVAFQNKSREEVLALTGLADTGEVDGANESPVAGASLPNGWYVLFLNDYDHPLIAPRALLAFSRVCRLLACQVEEHVMASSAAGYESGQRIWSTTHQSDKGRYNLEVQGSPPESFGAVRAALVKKQDDAGGEKADVDYVFDIPVELVTQLCSYRYDKWKFDWGQPVFTTLCKVTR
jgi:hypothetical protein